MTEPASESRAPFDPVARLFIAMDQRPESLAPVSVCALSPFQRALLVIDGTVTTFIEAYASEPVSIVRIDQYPGHAQGDARWLACEPAEAVIRRRTLLRGAVSDTLYAYATSVIVPARLSSRMRTGLEAEPEGLGKILLDSGLETRREGLWYGQEELTDLPAALDLPVMQCLSRSYRVFAGGLPLMLITERFPLSPPV